MVNPDCARSKLDKMCQMKGESIAQYHVRLPLQVARCSFANSDAAIRSKLLQTMSDKKLRREAMVKRYLSSSFWNTQQIKRTLTGKQRTWEKCSPLKQFQWTEYTKGDTRIPKGNGTKRKLPPNRRKTMGTCANTVDSTMRDHDPSAQFQEKHTLLAPRKVILPKCAKGDRKAPINQREPGQQQNRSSRSKTAHQTPTFFFSFNQVVPTQEAHPLFMF